MNITFVNKDDEVIGYGSREEAIEKGIIHRIVRVFVFNSNGELLIQKRSATVHLPNKWDQSAAGHVDEGEDYTAAAIRELKEEVGITASKLTAVTKFYTEEDDDSEVKKRFNEIYVLADYDGDVQIDTDEVSEYKWIDPTKLKNWIRNSPEYMTQGFIQTFNEYAKIKEL